MTLLVVEKLYTEVVDSSGVLVVRRVERKTVGLAKYDVFV